MLPSNGLAGFRCISVGTKSFLLPVVAKKSELIIMTEKKMKNHHPNNKHQRHRHDKSLTEALFHCHISMHKVTQDSSLSLLLV